MAPSHDTPAALERALPQSAVSRSELWQSHRDSLPAPDTFGEREMEDLKNEWRDTSLESSDAEGDETRRGLLRGNADADLEAQSNSGQDEAAQQTTHQHGAEYTVSTSRKALFLGLYFFFNLSLTIYNKAVLGSFAFPWLLTAVHTACAGVGCYSMMLAGHFKFTKLAFRENMVLVAFSLLFTLNIAMSNVSLSMVSVPFHQIARSTSPVCTILIYRVLYARTYARQTYLSLIPIIAGVGLATYGDYYFTALGFTLTFVGVLLASIKTVATNRLMTGSLKLPAMEVLLRMSPLAAVQSIIYACATGEMADFVNFARGGGLTGYLILAVVGNGVLAFVLNVASFQTNKLAGALTISVCANVKQCLTILLGIVLFNVDVSPVNGCGMLVALIGAAWYSKVEVASKGEKASTPPQGTLLAPRR